MSIRPFKNSYPTLSEGSYIDQDAVVIGDVYLGEHCSVWPGAVIRGDVNIIRIGNYSNIQDNSVLHTTHQSEVSNGAPLTIGNYVTVGHSVVLHGCVIHDFCLIGMQSIILDNAVIEPYVMIGAGSIVSPNKRLESGYLYLGSPVKQIRPLTSKEKAFLKYSAEHYVKLKNDYVTLNDAQL
jgi:carbonic anhydrase/acetyltransferase-like protein (isoleucine patch superfamily)